MKKIATLLLVGAIAGSTMVTNYIPTFAANKIDNDAFVADNSYGFTLEETIKNMEISDTEKNRLLKTEKDLENVYKQLSDLEEQWAEKYDKFYKDLDDKFDKVSRAHQDLWDKLYENIPDGEYEDDTSAYIKKSKVLTDEEKAILLEDEAKLDEIEAQYEARYKDVELETKDIRDQIDKLYAEIDAANDENSDIWKKFIQPCLYDDTYLESAK